MEAETLVAELTEVAAVAAAAAAAAMGEFCIRAGLAEDSGTPATCDK